MRTASEINAIHEKLGRPSVIRAVMFNNGKCVDGTVLTSEECRFILEDEVTRLRRHLILCRTYAKDRYIESEPRVIELVDETINTNAHYVPYASARLF